MKTISKIATLLIIIGTLTYTACKKNTTTPSTTKSSSAAQIAMSRQLALSIYKSLSSQSVKTNNFSKQRTFSASLCGQVLITPTNIITNSGDTTRKITGNSIFTYMCSKDTLNAYTLLDTMKVNETGRTFDNSYLVIQNYSVKLVNAYQGYSLTNGTMLATNHLSKVNASHVTTEFHDFSTQYTLIDMGIMGYFGVGRHFGGWTKFVSQTVDKDSTTPVDGNFTSFKGAISFIGDDYVFVFFDNADGSATSYKVVLTTGEVTPLPFTSYSL